MKRIAVLFGGKSHEHEVSIRSARAVVPALQRAGYEVLPVYVTKANMIAISPTVSGAGTLCLDGGDLSMVETEPFSCLGGEDIDVVLSVIHGEYGEDGRLQSWCELHDLPYVGSDSFSSSQCMDKHVTKLLVQDAGIAVSPYVLVHKVWWESERGELVERICSELGFPCYVKPCKAGSSIGVSKCEVVEDLDDALEKAFAVDDKVLVEQGMVDAMEIECAVKGRKGCPEVAKSFARIHVDGGFYDYEEKYAETSQAEVEIPAKLSSEDRAELQRVASRVYEVLGCAGLARVDVFLKGGQVYLNEVNTLPGFTSISGYGKMWAEEGVTLEDLLTEFVETL